MTYLNKELLQTMGANPWFASLALSERKALLSSADLYRVGVGEMLFRKGDTVGAFYGVVRGVFKISTLREDGREGILGVMEQGDWLGEAALLDGLPCPHDATAVQAGAVLLVNNQAFDGLMQRAAFARGIAKLLGSRVRVLYGLVEDGMLRATSTRIARRLLSLVRTDTSVGRLPHVPLSQEALAMMLGLTRQTLSRELKSLAAAGVVALGYRRIEIVSLSDLELLATLD